MINRRTIALLTASSIILFIAFIIIVAALHFLNPEVNPVHNFISEYAIGRYGYMMTSAFVCLSMGSFLLLIAFNLRLPNSSKTIISALLAFWSACVLTAAVFPTDISTLPETKHGHIHNIVSFLGFISIVACSFFAGGYYKRQEMLSVQLKLLPKIMLFLFLSTIITIHNGSPLIGLMQRLFICSVVSWLIIFALAGVRHQQV